ncbi:PAS domain-containing protein [Methanoculleus chikugoensis]|uniref:Uncharacterized protein n=1 Tax=Methanoculleus chikugoensis TaxID=118126 RepID=A0ABN5XMG6_9EURY|nr:PAS domain-containing protein [Methanoculleus chikugoensis]BBL69163.1 hypothetical protein MchiMG62_23440 [Methanoculleus chikugoensis]
MHRLTGMAEDRAVLLAEPDRPAAAKVSCWLQGEGYTVVGVVERGDEALAAAAASRPGFVVLDASLPCPESPLATALAIRDRLKIPVVFTTANPVNTLPLGGPEGLSREEILEKPFGPNDLAAAVEAVAARHRSGCLRRAWDEAFRRAADSIPSFVMILDANRRIRFVNLPGAIFAGRSRAALAGQDAVGTILPPSDRDGGYIRLRFEEGREVEFVVDCAPAGRCRVSVRWTCHPAQGPGERCAGWVCFGAEENGVLLPDSDSRERVLRQLEENVAQLMTLNDRIRNPLQVIAGLAGFMDGDVRDRILLQVEMIDETVRQLDLGALESTSIREYLRKHHRMAAP